MRSKPKIHIGVFSGMGVRWKGEVQIKLHIGGSNFQGWEAVRGGKKNRMADNVRRGEARKYRNELSFIFLRPR